MEIPPYRATFQNKNEDIYPKTTKVKLAYIDRRNEYFSVLLCALLSIIAINISINIKLLADFLQKRFPGFSGENHCEVLYQHFVDFLTSALTFTIV
jgi:hypothetical protein